MILYLRANTDLKDLMIDYIEVRLATGEIVSLNWDESDIERLETGFNARYKGVYFGEEYANGKIASLRDMQIAEIGIYTESESDSDIVITEMIFEDAGEQYDMEHSLPYIINRKECEMT